MSIDRVGWKTDGLLCPAMKTLRQYSSETKEVSITMQAHSSGGTLLHATPSIRYETSVFDARGNGDGEVAPTMTGDHQNRVSDYTGVVCNKQLTVRRLTPLECERLQGYPDGWTDIGEWTDSKGR